MTMLFLTADNILDTEILMNKQSNLRIVGSWELDLNTSELYWSDETKIIHGVPLTFRPNLEDAINFYKDDHKEKIQMAVNHLIELGENFDVDNCMLLPDGEEIWVRSTGLVVQRNGDEVVKIGGTFENVTDYYNKVNKLEKYWGILNESNMLTVSNKSGVIKFVNDSFCNHTGYDRSEVVGKTHRIFNSGYHSQEFFQEMWNTINSGEKWEGEILNKNKDGRLQWIKTVIFPIKDHKGELTELISIRSDITGEKELQKKKIEQERLRVVGEVGGQILHELMSPLTLIKSYTDSLNSLLEKEGNIEASQMTGKLQEASNRVIDIFKDMRSLLKDKDDYNYVNLARVIKRSYFFTHLQMQKQEISFNLDIDQNAGDIWGSQGQLTQVFTNLINNSIHAVESLDNKWIRVSVVEKDGIVTASVMDSGKGIDPATSEKVFESLFTTKMESGGTGLGLAISKRLIERMKGKIYIDDAKENTCFCLEFPVVNSDLKAG